MMLKAIPIVLADGNSVLRIRGSGELPTNEV